MSYACAGCARIGHFSSPNVLYGVTPTGIDHETDPDNSADNARSLNNTAFTVARFREVAPTDPPAMAPANLAATAVSYGQIDLSWDYSGDDHWSFEIERSIDQAGWAVVGFAIGNFTSYSDTTAYPSTTYSTGSARSTRSARRPGRTRPAPPPAKRRPIRTTWRSPKSGSSAASAATTPPPRATTACARRSPSGSPAASRRSAPARPITSGSST